MTLRWRTADERVQSAIGDIETLVQPGIEALRKTNEVIFEMSVRNDKLQQDSAILRRDRDRAFTAHSHAVQDAHRLRCRIDDLESELSGKIKDGEKELRARDREIEGLRTDLQHSRRERDVAMTRTQTLEMALSSKDANVKKLHAERVTLEQQCEALSHRVDDLQSAATLRENQAQDHEKVEHDEAVKALTAALDQARSENAVLDKEL